VRHRLTHRPAATLALAALGIALLAACGGSRSSKTPTSSAGTTPGAAKSAAAGTAKPGTTPGSVVPAQTPTTGQQTTVAAAKTAPGPAIETAIASGSPAPGTTPGAPAPTPIPNVTVRPDGTATNSEGTPVVLPPTAAAIATGSPAVLPTPLPPTPGIATGATISIDSLADASGDFSINVNISGATQPYVAFNVAVTFDPSVLSAVAIRPGAALAPDVEQTLCVKLPATPGTVGMGCTVFDNGATSTNGVLAIIKFHPLAPGTTVLHLKTLAEGGASQGTFTVTPVGPDRKPDIVLLADGSVTTQ
jgi:hypothetical protein